ncbi:unnamed protein product [Sphenostylis stenocarpa]|uniref:COX assembly mitochondrial protein n=1 Tax=Sphenostylis stenocarpa TaxID=92480 RepID=A0AA86VJG2_9FABA|nr:unnamed protein product [Sphenostylis stenocarpa]
MGCVFQLFVLPKLHLFVWYCEENITVGGCTAGEGVANRFDSGKMHPPLTLHKHPMCAEIIELFQKCHVEHPIAKFFGECTDLKIKLDRCFREEKALKRKANFEESKKLKEQLRIWRKENAASSSQ